MASYVNLSKFDSPMFYFLFKKLHSVPTDHVAASVVGIEEMSILSYFKLKAGPKVASTLDNTTKLPDLDGALSKHLPSSAIKMANDKVLKLGNMSSIQMTNVYNRPNGYLMLTSTQRCEIGKNIASSTKGDQRKKV